MNKAEELVLGILKSLHDADVLSEMMLIGSWCLPFYKKFFNNSPLIPLLRTTDIDFMIRTTTGLQKKVDVSQLLVSLGFSEHYDYVDNIIKYVHPDLEIDFVTPRIGMRKSHPSYISNLKISAQPLRYLTLLQAYPLVTEFHEIPVIFPEPAAYVIQKFLISDRRKAPAKKHKDLNLAVDIGRFLLADAVQKKRLDNIVREMIPAWRKKLLRVMKTESMELYNLFMESQEFKK